MFDLTGKRALVTGASGGIGQEIAKALVKAGAKVGAQRHARRQARGGGGRDRRRRASCPAISPSIADVDKLVPAAEAALGGLDILVNNAGMTRDNLFMRMKDEEWDEVLAVNLTAAFHLTRAVLRGMMKQRFGRIISITSVVGVAGNPGQGNYAASKAGHHRHGQGAGPGSRLPQHHRQRRGAGLHRLGHDRRAQRQAARGDPRQSARRAGWERPRKSPDASCFSPATQPLTSPATRST